MFEATLQGFHWKQPSGHNGDIARPGKPVDILIIENTKIDGREVNAGEIIEGCEAQLAVDLAGAGKARAATPQAIEEFKAVQEALTRTRQGGRDATSQVKLDERKELAAVVVQTLADAGVLNVPSSARR